jgi:hypothetical protein
MLKQGMNEDKGDFEDGKTVDATGKEVETISGEVVRIFEK